MRPSLPHTRLHEPEASHLDLLAAFVPPETIYAAYSEAIQHAIFGMNSAV